MRWLRSVRVRLRSFFRQTQVDRELDAELEFYVEQRTEGLRRARNVSRGRTREGPTIAGQRDARPGACTREPRPLVRRVRR